MATSKITAILAIALGFPAVGQELPLVELPRRESADAAAPTAPPAAARTWLVPAAVAAHGRRHGCAPRPVPCPAGVDALYLLCAGDGGAAAALLSADGGASWSEPAPLHDALCGAGFAARYAADGRLVVAFRDALPGSPTRGDVLAWVGGHDDLARGRAGHYRVRLLDDQPDADGPVALELLGDGRLLVTASVRTRPDAPAAPARVAFSLDETDALALPPARTHHRGREIARTMHYKGAPWLLRAEREREENATRLLAQLGVEPGQTVCDFGCGNGFHTLPLARAVGPEGRVLAVDVQQPMLTMLRGRAADAGLANIERVLSTPADPCLPPASCDLILLVDVYHELSHPEHVLRGLRAALRPGGRLALVEFRAEDPDVPIKPLHKMSKEQILAELPPNGFRLVGEYDGLPWQHLMFFAADGEGSGR